MNVKEILTKPFNNQKPGTGGLRKQTKVFMEPHFLENFIQSCLNVRIQLGQSIDTLVIGGDGRYPCVQLLPNIIKQLVANGVKKVIVVGRDLVAPTPAISYIISKYKTDGGFILSASHNPAGENGDFGVKIEMPNGGGAPEVITDKIAEETLKISAYKILDISDEDALNLPQVKFIDPIADYVELLQSMFDFDIIKSWFDNGHTFRFDAMNAATGDVAIKIFCDMLGAKKDWIWNSKPMPDFGGVHPEPNPAYASDIYKFMMEGGADFAAVCDGDGDRNMILGSGVYVQPSDSLAIMVKYHNLIPYYKNGLIGIARTRPTSSSVDKVAEKMGTPVYKTPTGWKFFANLLDAGKINICGEESFGQGGDYIREKDGLFAVLFWLEILSKTGLSVREILDAMWCENGRVFYSQYSYEGVDKVGADDMISYVLHADLVGKSFGNFIIQSKEVFEYVDPITGDVSKNQGMEIKTENGVRIFVRLSGTGTIGATVRFYVEKYETDASLFNKSYLEYMQDVFKFVEDLFEIKKYLGDIKPSSIN